MVLLPYLISYVIVAYIVNVFLSDTGIFNTILGVLGKDPVSWYTEKKYWPFILTFVNSWKSLGFTTIIYLSTIVGFGRDYYEAAELDGAGKWKQITKITIPMLKPTIILMVTLGTGYAAGWFRKKAEQKKWNLDEGQFKTDADKENEENRKFSGNVAVYILFCLLFFAFASVITVIPVPYYFTFSSAITDLADGSAKAYGDARKERIAIYES